MFATLYFQAELTMFLFQNLTSWTWMSLLKSLYIYETFIMVNSNVRDLIKYKYIAFNNIITHALLL